MSFCSAQNRNKTRTSTSRSYPSDNMEAAPVTKTQRVHVWDNCKINCKGDRTPLTKIIATESPTLNLGKH